MDLERAASMIKALPFMSKTIVDDTIYEKVLSFLTLVLSNHSQQDIAALDQTCHFYDHIHKACLDRPDQDYRVITLCIRLTGQLVYYGGNRWFDALEQQYPALLDRISISITSSEATLRCACIEACRLFLSSTKGQHWLKNNKEITSLIMYALLDQSSYVVSEACQLFSTLLTLELDPLLQMMDPTMIVQSILQSKGDQHQIMSALDFCWTLVSIDKKESAIQFIRSRQLMHSIIPLLNSNHRMIRSRLLEILSALFSWDDDPLETLGLQHTTPGIEQAYTILSEASMKTIREAATMDQLTTAISLLETVFVLLKRTSMDLSKDAYLILCDLVFICLDKDHPSLQAIQHLLKSDRTRNNLLQLVIRLIDTLTKINPNHPCITQAQHDTILLNVLACETAYTDTRVLKETLALLIDTLKSIKDNKALQTLWAKAMHALVLIMTDLLDCKSFSILLSSMDILLSHDSIGSLDNALLADALSLKFIDTAWDIRDAAIHFVGQLFDAPYCKFKIQFSLTHHLPLQVFERIHDTEPYVRASAIEVLRRMMVSKEGWEYIQQNQVSRDLASQLPRFLHDTEAFVRRATLDAIICLVQHRSCQGMAMEIESSDHSLNPFVLQNLIQDDDTEVRIRTCRLLESLRYLYYHEQQQNKKRNTLDTFVFFHHIKAAELLTEAAVDTNRVVRMEAIRVIESILSEYQSPITTNTKRVREQDLDSFDTQFIATLSQVNLDQQKQTLDPEHLYEEAFDINADMMTQSIVPNNPDDDMNMLDCY